ncbi:MAG: hypothetical protein KAG96_02045 [Ichthyobacteriaceae bacterium]|nr:hypothetical protein [Ichthyobacteriaceae bacterium]
MLIDISEDDLNIGWNEVKNFLSDKFADGEKVDVETILYLIGVQELGTGKNTFEKEEKVELMHMATCLLLEPFGYFKLQQKDIDGWLHFKQIKSTDNMSGDDQFKMLKIATINYFKNNVW